MNLRHIPDGNGTHRFLRDDGSEVIRVYLPQKLSKAEKIASAERLIALATALATAG